MHRPRRRPPPWRICSGYTCGTSGMALAVAPGRQRFNLALYACALSLLFLADFFLSFGLSSAFFFFLSAFFFGRASRVARKSGVQGKVVFLGVALGGRGTHY